MNPNYKLTTSELVELLKKEMEEEQNLRSSIRSTMNIYITILVAMLGGVITILSTRSETMSGLWLGVILLLCGILVCTISFVGIRHYRSDYRRQAESIVQQAKLEDILGMDDPKVYPLSKYWLGESLLPESFVNSRKRYKNSQEFVNWFIKETDFKFAKVLYYAFILIGIALFVLGILSLFNIL